MEVEKTYVISLKGSERKFDELTPIFPSIEKFPAVDGRKLDMSTVPLSERAKFYLSRGRELHEDLPSKGAIGCFLSHLSVWKTALEKVYNSIAILEDDAEITPFITSFNNNHIDELDYDILMIAHVHPYDKLQKFSPRFDRIKGRFWGTVGYFITNKGIKKILPLIDQIETQIDSQLGIIAANHPEVNIYVMRYPIVRNKPVKSMIQKP